MNHRVSACLAILSIHVLVACGGASPEPQPAPPSTGEPAPAPSAAPAASTAEPSASTAPPASAAPAVSANKPAESETVELTIHPSKLTIDEKQKVVRFDPDRGRMVATTRVYEFKYDEYVAAVGKDNLKKEVKILAALLTDDVASSPGDPNGARPLGGFQNHQHAAKVVKVLEIVK